MQTLQFQKVAVRREFPCMELISEAYMRTSPCGDRGIRIVLP
jgi:hypothetical protein